MRHSWVDWLRPRYLEWVTSRNNVQYVFVRKDIISSLQEHSVSKIMDLEGEAQMRLSPRLIVRSQSHQEGAEKSQQEAKQGGRDHTAVTIKCETHNNSSSSNSNSKDSKPISKKEMLSWMLLLRQKQMRTRSLKTMLIVSASIFISILTLIQLCHWPSPTGTASSISKTSSPLPPLSLPVDTVLSDVFISVKTTRSYHKSRLQTILATWFTLARKETWFFTDHDDPQVDSASGMHF